MVIQIACSGENTKVPDDTHLALAVWTEGMEELNMMRQKDRLWGEEGSQPELGIRCTRAPAPNMHSV